MWGLGRGGRGVLKGMPPPEKQGGEGGGLQGWPFPFLRGRGEEGEWAAGALGAGLLAAGWNSSLAARGWPVTGPGLRDSASVPRPCKFPQSGCDSVPGDCTFISDSWLSETDGWLRARLCGVCLCFSCTDRRSPGQTHAHGQALG